MQLLKIFLLALAFSCVSFAQTAAPKGPSHRPKPGTSTAAATSHDDSPPVITIEKLCLHPKPNTACKTVVTKNEFERLVAAVRPNLPAAARKQLAERYVELLTFADKAEQAGLDKSPEFQERLQLMRMQALTVAYNQYLQDKYAKASDAEIEKYYNESKTAYEEVTLRRIYIPKPPSGAEKKPALDEAATKALAEKIQARAAAGEDFDKLQEEASAAANPDAPKTAASPTTLGPRRRGQLPASQEEVVFGLAPGKVSRLLDEPAGYFIYKVESKQLLPLTQVKAQIARQLEEQRMRDAIQQTISSAKATYNDSYFKAPDENEAMPGASQPNTSEPDAGKSNPTPSAKPK